MPDNNSDFEVKNKQLVRYKGHSSTLKLPNDISIIGFGAFEGCESLEQITIPDSVTEIGDGAFEACWSLKEITIPDSVTKIGDYAFSGCSDLIIITNNPVAIKYAEEIGIPVKPLNTSSEE